MTLGPAPSLRLAAALCASALATGCSHFQSSRRLDMTPFADNTVTTIGEMQKLNKPMVWVQLRRFRTHPAVVKATDDVKPVRQLMRNIAFYSAQLVSLNDSALSDQRKAKELARYLREVVKPALEDSDAPDWGVTLPDLDRISQDMQKQETFMAAIAAAEPLVNATLQYGLKLFDRLDADLVEASAVLDAAVDAQYGALGTNVLSVYDAQQRTTRAYALLYRYRLGDPVLDELRAALPAGSELLPADKPPTVKQLQTVEDTLAAQMARLKAAREQLDPDLASFREAKAELDTLRANTVEHMRAGRVTLIMWARSHRNLGHGIAVPPVIDLKGMLFNTAGAAAGKVVPF